MSEPVVSCRDLRKTYQGPAPVQVLQGVNLEVRAGERIAIVGRSGSGKSTLLHVLGGLDSPTGGSVLVQGKPFSSMSEAERGRVRNATLGFVYQFHHLLPEFDARDNVALPMRIAGHSEAEARRRAETLLTGLGLGERFTHQPAQLSGGEQQRVAIARSLANNPRLLLADEPTGNLDPTNSHAVFEALRELAKTTGVAALIATHNMELAGHMDRVFALKDGHLEERAAEAQAY